MNFEKMLKFLCVSASRAESIGILLVEINSLVAKLFLAVFYTQLIPGRSASVKYGTLSIISLFSARRPESNDMLTVKIGPTVKRLFEVEYFHENFPLAPLERNFEKI
jgi:hypothetical protein